MTTKDFKIQVFGHPQFGEIRVTGTSDEPLFCLVDICKVLELNNTSMAKRKLKATGIKIFEVRSELTNKHGKTIAFMDNLTFISEQNLYRLIMRSTKPMAEPFQDWVCGEVLPSIRKHGGYILTHEGDTDEDIRRRAEEVLRTTLEQKDKLISEQKVLLEQKNRRIAEQDVEIDRLLPKALYTDSVLESISCYTTTQIAKELGMTAQELNRWLCAERIQYYQSGQYMPVSYTHLTLPTKSGQYMLYADYAHRGLAKSRTHYDLFVGRDTVLTRMYLVWTEKGREFIHLRAKGVRELRELRS